MEIKKLIVGLILNTYALHSGILSMDSGKKLALIDFFET